MKILFGRNSDINHSLLKVSIAFNSFSFINSLIRHFICISIYYQRQTERQQWEKRKTQSFNESLLNTNIDRSPFVLYFLFKHPPIRFLGLMFALSLLAYSKRIERLDEAIRRQMSRRLYETTNHCFFLTTRLKIETGFFVVEDLFVID